MIKLEPHASNLVFASDRRECGNPVKQQDLFRVFASDRRARGNPVKNNADCNFNKVWTATALRASQ